MEDIPTPTPDTPAAAAPTPPPIPEKPVTEIPPAITPHAKRKFSSRPLFYLLILAAFLPVATAAVFLRQSIAGEASSGLFCRYKVTLVMISPGQISARENGPDVHLSALAYDKNNQPLWTGVTYQWGMSSTASIGNLIPENQIATFTPQNAGTGDVYVTAYYCKNKKVTASVSAVVLPRPTVAPTITPTATPEPSPTATPSVPTPASISVTPIPILLPP